MNKSQNNIKLNVSQILKNEQEGLKLWSPLFGDLTFELVQTDTECDTFIYTRTPDKALQIFDPYGFYNPHYVGNNAECVLFPSKDHRTWEDWEEYKKSIRESEEEELYPTGYDDMLDTILEDSEDYVKYYDASSAILRLHAAYWIWKKQDSEARKDDTTLVIKLRDGALELHYQCKDSETPFLSFNSRQLATKFMQTFETQLKMFFNIK